MSRGDMSISAFARRSLLSIKALRLYDEMGLLRPERIDPSSGYRYYSENQLDSARLISLLRKLDVPLAEIADMIDRGPSETSRALNEWWMAEEARISMRRDLLNYISGSVLGDPAGRAATGDAYRIGVREMPETTYLYRSRHVHGPELHGFIVRSLHELGQQAKQYGGACGECVVIFHGVVDLDSDGPADVCLPISPGSVALDGHLVRTESAHLQAFTVLRKHQVEFPQILQVYQALGRWIEANGYARSGPPREMYLENFDDAGVHEPVCEVAYPIQPTRGEELERS